MCGSVLSPLSQHMVERWAAEVQAGNSVIAFSVPEAGLPALNQKRQSLSVMAQLIIKHVSFLRRAPPPIYFHLSDRDGCTNSISAINKGSIHIIPFLQKQITRLINGPVTVNSSKAKINKKETKTYSLALSLFSRGASHLQTYPSHFVSVSYLILPDLILVEAEEHRSSLTSEVAGCCCASKIISPILCIVVIVCQLEVMKKID